MKSRHGTDDAHYRIADPDERHALLTAKLFEESQEYKDHPSIAELADILEVVISLAQWHGVDRAGLYGERLKKKNLRGGFDQFVVWDGEQ